MAEFFAGASLVNKTGDAATLEVGPDTVVGVFFSSSWCPDCKPFVLTLAAMYEELNEDEYTTVQSTVVQSPTFQQLLGTN